jgi:hypothetical protein
MQARGPLESGPLVVDGLLALTPPTPLGTKGFLCTASEVEALSEERHYCCDNLFAFRLGDATDNFPDETLLECK